MTDEEREKMRVWVKNWKRTGEFLENLRREEIRNSDLEQTILALSDAFESALFLEPNKKTSGLVEFYKILAKSR